MGKYSETSALVDNILLLIGSGMFIGIGFTAPQLLQVLDKPAHKLLDKYDGRAKERKLHETIMYMRREGLLIGDYGHGITVSKKAEARILKYQFESLVIDSTKKWDKKWRILFFDIPEQNRDKRALFTSKVKRLGFQPLQQSVWIHPYACKSIIARICSEYGVEKWVTYVVTAHIDHEELLIKRFKHIL